MTYQRIYIPTLGWYFELDGILTAEPVPSLFRFKEYTRLAHESCFHGVKMGVCTFGLSSRVWLKIWWFAHGIYPFLPFIKQLKAGIR